jgi:tRNA uridine 5-carbamoylmethylation protein Kti12
MTWQSTNLSRENIGEKIRRYPTKVINLIGGPGSKKSLISSDIILQLYLHNKTVEHLADYAKYLVWQRDFESLKNQYYIAHKQYKVLRMIDGEVQFIVVEGSLPQLLYYNRNFKDNICDMGKTEIQIKKWYSEFENINIFVERDDSAYVKGARIQNEDEIKEIDQMMMNLLRKNNIPFTCLPPDIVKINEFIKSTLLKPN